MAFVCGLTSGTLDKTRVSCVSRRQARRVAVVMAGDTIGIGVIGCGRIGQVHAKTIAGLQGAELVGMVDPFEELGKKVCAQFNTEYNSDFNTLVKDTRVQGIVIGSPTPYHAEQIMACADAGKDIFCEKPISNDLEVIDKCLSVVKEKNVRLLVGFQRRFDPNFRKIKQSIEAGAIGSVRMFHITSRDPAPPPAEYLAKSGGIFLDMISHDYDMARFVTSSDIDEVFVTAKAFDSEAKEANDFDSLITVLRMKNGTFGTIDNSRRCSYGYDQRIEVFGEKGALYGNNLSPNDVVLSTSDSIREGLPFSFFMDRYTEAYAGIMEEFVNMIRERKEPSVSGLDGRAPILAAIACKKSAIENRPVKLSEI